MLRLLTLMNCCLPRTRILPPLGLHSKTLAVKSPTPLGRMMQNSLVNWPVMHTNFLESKDFWRVVRRTLPKFRNRKIGQDPHKMDALQDQWGPYFMQLESGVRCEPEHIVDDCHKRQMALPTVQACFCHPDLPSIIELEDALRETKADRSTRLDPIPSGLYRSFASELASVYFPLLLKICIWQHEPVMSKGGQVAVIYQKKLRTSSRRLPRYYMLLSSLAKRVHALLRSRLMRLLGRVRPQGQLGGFPAMQVPFGSQTLQTFGRLMDAIDVSSAIITLNGQCISQAHSGARLRHSGPCRCRGCS